MHLGSCLPYSSLTVVQAHAAAGLSGGAMVKIPMLETHVRSLNLAVSVGVGLYEAIRQLDYAQHSTHQDDTQHSTHHDAA